MRVLILNNAELEEKDIKNNLDEFQSIVGGYIETPFLGNCFTDNGIVVVINEDGKFRNLNPEIILVNGCNVIDTVVGNVVFVGLKNCDFVSLTDEQVDIITNCLSDIGIYDGNIVRVLKI